MSEVVRFGVIGAGWPARQHCAAIAHVPGATLGAVCDVDAERCARFSAEFSAPRRFACYEEMLSEGGIDAVIICVPNFLHVPISMAALESGCHVLCEKPPALSAREMEMIRSEVRVRGLAYAFSRQSRFAAGMLAAREAVHAGRLGQIYYGTGKWVRLRGTPTGVGGWFTSRAGAGGGAIIDLGVHCLDSVWYLAGCPRMLSATAQTGAYFPGAGEVEDTGMAFMRFEGGLAVSLEIAWSMNLAGQEAAPSEWWGLETIQTRLHGTNAGLQIEPAALWEVHGAQFTQTPLALPEDAYSALPWPVAGFARQLEDFVSAVKESRDPASNVDQAVELMRMLDAIYASSEQGREVR